jgi:hypothetical protein
LLRFIQLPHFYGAVVNPKPLASLTAGQSRRLEWLAGRLRRYLEGAGFFDAGPRPAVKHYMAFGFSMGFCRVELEASLASMPELQPIAASLSDEEISQGKPAPEFLRGQLVELVTDLGNVPYRKAAVRGRNWHQKQGRWVYFLEEDGGKVSRRYEARDLRAAGGCK